MARAEPTLPLLVDSPFFRHGSRQLSVVWEYVAIMKSNL